MPIRFKLPRERWAGRDVVDFIVACIVEDRGIPMFKTKFAGMPIDERGVLALCFAGDDRVPSRIFYDVPPEDMALMREKVGDWRYLLRKYGSREDIAKVGGVAV